MEIADYDKLYPAHYSMAVLRPHFTVNYPSIPENVHVYCDICITCILLMLFSVD